MAEGSASGKSVEQQSPGQTTLQKTVKAQERREKCLSQGAAGRNTEGGMELQVHEGLPVNTEDNQKGRIARRPKAQTLEPGCLGLNSTSVWPWASCLTSLGLISTYFIRYL